MLLSLTFNCNGLQLASSKSNIKTLKGLFHVIKK